jgi:hypothetical protein
MAQSKSTAIAQYKKTYGSTGPFLVYQYEKGHWGYCTPASPVGQDLQTHGMVSSALRIPAKQWEIVNQR